MKTFFLTTILIFFTITAYARELPCNNAKCIKNDTTNYDNALSATDTRSQTSFETLDDFLDLETLATYLCDSPQMNCWYTSLADCPDTDKCFVYEDSVVRVYVNNGGEWQWPEEDVFDKLLLETGDFILLEDGTSKILLE